MTKENLNWKFDLQINIVHLTFSYEQIMKNIIKKYIPSVK